MDRASATAAAEPSVGAKLNCGGQLALGRPFPWLAADARLVFETSFSFGEGELIALVDPETSKINRVIYDAEATVGSLHLPNGYEATIVWTRMSGSGGPLIGHAVTSEGDVIALSVERAPAGSCCAGSTMRAASGAS